MEYIAVYREGYLNDDDYDCSDGKRTIHPTTDNKL